MILVSSFKITGLNDLQKQFEELKRSAEEIDNTESIRFGKLFNTDFMRKHTRFSSIDELFASGGFNVENYIELDSIPNDKIDDHIAATTIFKSWEEMLGQAGEEYVIKNLGL
jgi:hypothetical protein